MARMGYEIVLSNWSWQLWLGCKPSFACVTLIHELLSHLEKFNKFVSQNPVALGRIVAFMIDSSYIPDMAPASRHWSKEPIAQGYYSFLDQ